MIPRLMRPMWGLALAASIGACNQPAPVQMARSDSARRAFSDTVAATLLDTTLYELRGQLYVKIINPNKDDESPLADQAVPHPVQPGPHTLDGKLYAEIGVLRALLGDNLPVRLDTAREHVFVGEPPVLLISHRHGGATYVPVKLFARQYGAYADIGCTLANCGYIWPRSIIEQMATRGVIGTGVLEGFAEGIIKGVDVTRLPSG